MIESLTNLIQFLVLILVFVHISFLCETSLCKLSNLNLIALSVENASFILFVLDSKHFDLQGKSFDLHSLKNKDVMWVIPKVVLFVVREIGDAGFSQIVAIVVIGGLDV